jgi:hypothetical protein
LPPFSATSRQTPIVKSNEFASFDTPKRGGIYLRLCRQAAALFVDTILKRKMIFEKWRRAIANWLDPDREKLAQENKELQAELNRANARVELLSKYIDR